MVPNRSANFQAAIDHELKRQGDDSEVDHLGSHGQATARIHTDLRYVEPCNGARRHLEGADKETDHHKRQHVPAVHDSQTAQEQEYAHEELANDHDGSAPSSLDVENDKDCKDHV